MEIEFNQNGFVITDRSLWHPIKVDVRNTSIDEVIKIFKGKRPRGYCNDTEYWSYCYAYRVSPTLDNPLSISGGIPVRFFKDIIKELKEKKKFNTHREITPHTKEELLNLSIPELNRLYNNLCSWQ